MRLVAAFPSQPHNCLSWSIGNIFPETCFKEDFILWLFRLEIEKKEDEPHYSTIIVTKHSRLTFLLTELGKNVTIHFPD